MSLEAACPGCGHTLRVAATHAGKAARCPVCGMILRIGDASSPPMPAEPEPIPVAISRVEPAAVPLPSAPVSAANKVPTSPAPNVEVERWLMRVPEGPLYGPVAKRELDQWLAEGRVSVDCQLQRFGSEFWIPAGNVYPELLGAAPPNPVPRSPTESHRGLLVLLLGVCSWLTCCPVFGAAAWTLGNHDLDAMRNGRMDISGVGLTQGGRLLGLWHTLLAIVAVLVASLIGLIAAAL